MNLFNFIKSGKNDAFVEHIVQIFNKRVSYGKTYYVKG